MEGMEGWGRQRGGRGWRDGGGKEEGEEGSEASGRKGATWEEGRIEGLGQQEGKKEGRKKTGSIGGEKYKKEGMNPTEWEG